MSIWNKYFKVVIYKETADVHSGVQMPTVNKRSSEHLPWDSHDTGTEHDTLSATLSVPSTAQVSDTQSLCKSGVIWTQQNQKPEI